MSSQCFVLVCSGCALCFVLISLFTLLCCVCCVLFCYCGVLCSYVLFGQEGSYATDFPSRQDRVSASLLSKRLKRRFALESRILPNNQSQRTGESSFTDTQKSWKILVQITVNYRKRAEHREDCEGIGERIAWYH